MAGGPDRNPVWHHRDRPKWRLNPHGRHRELTGSPGKQPPPESATADAAPNQDQPGLPSEAEAPVAPRDGDPPVGTDAHGSTPAPDLRAGDAVPERRDAAAGSNPGDDAVEQWGRTPVRTRSRWRCFMDPMQQAQFYRNLNVKAGLPYEEIAECRGISKSTVSTYVALLNLCRDVREMVAQGDLTPGAAYPLRKITDPETQLRVANEAVREELTEAEVKARVARELGAGGDGASTS